MPSNTELRAQQCATLFDLLQLQYELTRENKDSNIELDSLKKLIVKSRAPMTQEDVAWVEKQIAELYQ